MSLARVFSRANVGVTAPEVTVEVHVGNGLPRISMVGLPQTAVRESKDRVKAALLNAGFEFPDSLVTISLAPADLPKEGSRFDLPIALGILAASAQVDDHLFGEYEFVGELALSGRINPVRGILPAAVQADQRRRGIVIPSVNGPEAALAGNSHAFGANTLLDVVDWLHGRCKLPPADLPGDMPEPCGKDLADVYGQPVARRALEVAAAGAHNLLFSGPPGTGKTMLASRLPGILPPMEPGEALDAATVASVSKNGFEISNWNMRRFRAPHHTASSAALVGGGSQPSPGEISLAHHGVLFLDELPEFNRDVLEVLREPMESGSIMISRAAFHAEFPACFQLVAAMNPCPCGFAGDRSGRCNCTSDQVRKYRAKISGPLLDRIDLHVEVARPDRVLYAGAGPYGESTETVRRRVVSARRLQLDRAGIPNTRLDNDGINKWCRLDAGLEEFLEAVARKKHLSPRACQRILKVARTIADLEESDGINHQHLAEAISYRGIDCGRVQE